MLSDIFQEPYPCETCPMYGICAEEEVACDQFREYVRSGNSGGETWRAEEWGNPTRMKYLKTMKD